MGNYKFRLSDMIPNAWFYKLRDMNNPRSHNTTSHPIKKKLPPPLPLLPPPPSQRPNHSHQRPPSYYYTSEPIRPDPIYTSPTNPKFSDTHFPDPPRKSSNTTRPKRKTIYKPSPNKQDTSSASKPESSQDQGYFVSSRDTSPEPEFESTQSWSSSCTCRVSSSTTDIIIDMNEKPYYKKNIGFDGFDTISEVDLPPILTKPAKLEERESHIDPLSIKIVKENTPKTQKQRKTPSCSNGVKLRSNSPRLGSKKVQFHGRKSVSKARRGERLSESFAIVKSSFDPQKDFRESMMEMVVENNIRASKDLEELLACYLSLNSDEYHDLIVKAFEQIWFNMPHLNA